MSSFKFLLLISGQLLLCINTYAQSQNDKQVNNNFQSWISLNTTWRFGDHWGATGDVHMRRNNFVTDPSFYTFRVSGGYWFTNRLALTSGYTHLWLATPTPSGFIFAHENRWDQQLSVSGTLGKVNVLQRFRAEHRWREIIRNYKNSGAYTFAERLRYLYSFTIPISSNPKVPQLAAANEILLLFGKHIIYNTFDQLRLFGGIRHNIGNGWSYDFGYMLVYQQKASGNQYDANHTIRLFFYYTRGNRKIKPGDLQLLQTADE